MSARNEIDIIRQDLGLDKPSGQLSDDSDDSFLKISPIYWDEVDEKAKVEPDQNVPIQVEPMTQQAEPQETIQPPVNEDSFDKAGPSRPVEGKSINPLKRRKSKPQEEMSESERAQIQMDENFCRMLQEKEDRESQALGFLPTFKHVKGLRLGNKRFEGSYKEGFDQKHKDEEEESEKRKPPSKLSLGYKGKGTVHKFRKHS